MLIDVKKEKRQINRASRAAYGGPHMTHIHRLTVTAELGEGRDRDASHPRVQKIQQSTLPTAPLSLRLTYFSLVILFGSPHFATALQIFEVS
jgi:predicted aconitase